MTGAAKPRVLFYHNGFFRRSETFIYRQAINPYVEPILVSKRYYKTEELPVGDFTKFRFKQSVIDYIGYKWFNKSYYGVGSVTKMKQLLQGQSPVLIHAQFGGNGVRILPLAKLMNLPLVVSFHGFDASRKLANIKYKEGLKDVFDYASAIIVCNPGMSNALPLSDKNKPKVHWVPYGIDIEQFSNNVTSAKRNSFNILHVGRLVGKKGVPDLIRAFAQATKEMGQTTLHIVGDGKEQPACVSLVKEFNLQSNVIFHGWKSPNQVKELMQQCDLFVLNSRVDSTGDEEGLPNGLLEAMAMGKPALSTFHAGIPLAIENEVSGVLVKERDTNSLSQQMVRLYHNPELREAMGKAARAKIEKEFTLKRMHENLRDVYAKVIDK